MDSTAVITATVYDLQDQRATFPSCRWLGMAGLGSRVIYMHGNCYPGTILHEMGHNYNCESYC
ncbi:hypothetical protein HaLaN_14162 [Haematococcus lacustris]|uniref:Peptidase M11 gametolysin domain-containing protein n=1 Tax=Haematococcus lacustris TaxID=44745 RepID=A0A699Z4E7_HAELA|nr:hypothetical protein HaLaN_14162 [Haematococcus lacustris]